MVITNVPNYYSKNQENELAGRDEDEKGAAVKDFDTMRHWGDRAGEKRKLMNPTDVSGVTGEEKRLGRG